MYTRFGRFILSKKSSTLFLILMPMAVLMTAWQTEWAIGFLLGRTHIWGIACILQILLTSLCITYDRAVKEKSRRVTCAVKILTCFLIYDIILVAPWFLVCRVLSAPELLEATVTLGLILAAVLLVVFGRRNTKKVVTKKYEISMEGLKDTCRIALISDLHLGIFVRENHVKNVVQCINAMKPDLVVIAGDILDVDHSILQERDTLNAISRLLQKITSQSGAYLVLGNHDPAIDNRVFRKFIKDSNIRLLHNETVELSNILLAGRTDAASNERKPIADILSKTESSKPVILVDHDPQGIREAQQYGIPLVLCGHTHKGQFSPMGFFTKRVNGKHYYYGQETFDHTRAIISSGAGYFNLPIRIGSNNEVVEIILQGTPEQKPEK